MGDEIMPQNNLLRNSEDNETSTDADRFAAYYLRRKCQVSLSQARVIAELLTGIGGAE